ncbi:MAG: hypothetical protein Q9218_006441 [Villophora microphyllina]
MADAADDNHQIIYLNDYPSLRADAPNDHPHLVDPASLDDDGAEEPLTSMTIPDLVVTVLLHYPPAALKVSLDPGRAEVYFLRKAKFYLDSCISRKGKIVKIGYLNEKETGGWDHLFTYRIDGISMGKWSPVSMTMLQNTPAEKNITNLKEIRVGAVNFTSCVAGSQPWVYAEDVEIEVVTGLWQGIGEL